MTETEQKKYELYQNDSGEVVTQVQVPTGELVSINFNILEGPWGDSWEDTRYQCDFLTPDSIVVDIGAYLGEYCSKISKKYQCHVYAYEPIEEYYNHIVETTEYDPLLIKVRPRKMGVSNSTGTEEIFINNAGSALKKYDKESGDAKTTIIETIDVIELFDQILKETNKKEIDLVKINIEGAEFDIIPRIFESGWASKIKNMHVQFHEFIEDSYLNYLSIKSEMEKTHNVVLDSLWKWTYWQRKEDE